MSRRLVRCLGAALLSSLLLVALVVTPASAHVTIDTLGDAVKGGFAKLGFSVPNERDDSGTVTIEVQLPQDQPLAFVSVQPKAGWDVETTMRTLDAPLEVFGTSYTEVVGTITWTAQEGVQIGPGQFEHFWVSVGPLPSDVDQLAFPTVQTYASGEVVRWIEPTPEGGEEPEHPVPTVALVDSGDGSSATHGDDHSTDSESPAAADDGDDGDDSDDDDDSALPLIALIVALVGLGAGLAALTITLKRGRA